MQDTKRFSITLPLEFYDWLKQQAKEKSRSMNGEIVELLKQAKEQSELKS